MAERRPSSHRARTVGAGAAAAALSMSLGLPASTATGDVTVIGSASDLGGAVATISPDDLKLERVRVHNRYLVQTEGKAIAHGGSRSAIKSAQQRAKAGAKGQGVTMKVDREYSDVWNGMSVTVDDSEVEKLRAADGVVAVYPVYEVERPEPVDNAEPQNEFAQKMTGADIARNDMGLTGKGVKVGVIDSGIDYNNPSLGGSGTNNEKADFPNKRVVGGYDFVGDDYDASGRDGSPTPTPDEFPDDTGGHGTHVAGIIGGDGDVQGVAPEADLYAYRIFGTNGSASTDVILAAMDRSAQDGMDVVNMSLGSGLMTWKDYPTAQAADAMHREGISMIVAMGNDGAYGTFTGGSPGTADEVISVGSVDNTHYRSPFFTTEAGAEIAYAPGSPAPQPPTSGTMELVAAGADDDKNALACNGSDLPKATGEQTLLIKRGECSFHEKAVNAEKAGYKAVIIYNNTAGTINASLDGDPKIGIPTVTITQADGLALQKDIADGGATFTWQDGTVATENETGGYMSDFSSYGLTADLDLKPTVSAPGGAIWSTIPVEQGGEGAMSGTSMATPHVAGVVAQMLQDNPDLTTDEIRIRLQNTADQLDFGLKPNAGLNAPVHHQGGGIVNVPEAVKTSTLITTDRGHSHLALGEGEQGPVTKTITIRNTSDKPVTYDLGVRYSVATGGEETHDPTFMEAKADVTFSKDTVTVPAGGSETVDVTFSEDFGQNGIIHGGWITVTDPMEEHTVPFAGMSGDYQALPLLVDGGMGLPVLGKAKGDSVDIAGKHPTYTMQGDDRPYIIYRLNLPAETAKLEIFTANADGSKGAPVHPKFNTAWEDQHVTKSADYFIADWTGEVQGNNGNNKSRTVPSGDYVMELKVLKPMGDPKNPAHWETWESGSFTIDRPGEKQNPGKGKKPAKPGKGNGKG